MLNQTGKRNKQTTSNKINRLAGTVTIPLNLKRTNTDRAIGEAKKRYFEKRRKNL
jgi:hypothetical protein